MAAMIPGVTARLTTGGVPVLRLHYTADPGKRPGTPAGDVWLADSAAGYPGGRRSPRWRKEMEIEYGAMGGTRLFPDWESWVAAGRIVIPPFDPVGYRLYGSYDHGWRNPAAFHVHGIDTDGRIVTLWEFYAAQVPVPQIARLILGHPITTPDGRRFPGNPFAGRLGFIVADPSIWAEDQPMVDNTTKSIGELFRRSEVPLLKGERGGDTMVAEWLHGYWWIDLEAPRYRICATCPALIQEIGGLRHKELSAHLAVTRNAPEAFVDKDDHAWDGLKMFLQRFPPSALRPRPAQQPASFQWWRKQAQASRKGEPVQTYQRGMLA